MKRYKLIKLHYEGIEPRRDRDREDVGQVVSADSHGRVATKAGNVEQACAWYFVEDRGVIGD